MFLKEHSIRDTNFFSSNIYLLMGIAWFGIVGSLSVEAQDASPRADSPAATQDEADDIPETEEESAARKMFEEAANQIIKDIAIQVKEVKLPVDRKQRISQMAVAAYQMNGNAPLWDVLLDSGDGADQQISDLLKFNGLSGSLRIPPISEIEPEVYLHENSPVATDDLMTTLRLAEACLMLKEGPLDLDLGWGENWFLDDFSGEGDSENHMRRLSHQFAVTVANKPDSQIGVAIAYVPKNWVYRRLMEEFVKLDTGNEPPQLFVTEFIRVGDEFEQAKELAIYLQEEGFLSEKALGSILSIPDDIYTKDLAGGVKAYQRSKGLDSDGILGPATADRLSQSQQIERNQILLNLHRARYLPNNPGNKYLLVNLPSAAIYGLEASEITSQIRVIFGKNEEGSRTPIFRDQMEFVVFHPKSTSRGSESRLLNSKYLSSLSRQLDSDDDKGKVSFIFPNSHKVFFHDFGSTESFGEENRATSKRAMQIQKPGEMARWVLKDHIGWNPYAVERAMNSGDNQWVKLKEPIAVYIVYFTAFPKTDQSSGINFHFDYYKRDKIDQEELKLSAAR